MHASPDSASNSSVLATVPPTSSRRSLMPSLFNCHMHAFNIPLPDISQASAARHLKHTAPPAILATMRLRLAPLASICRRVSRIPVSATSSVISARSPCSAAAHMDQRRQSQAGVIETVPMHDPRAYVTASLILGLFISASPPPTYHSSKTPSFFNKKFRERISR